MEGLTKILQTTLGGYSLSRILSALLTLLVAQTGRKDKQGRTPWQWQGQWLSEEKK